MSGEMQEHAVKKPKRAPKQQARAAQASHQPAYGKDPIRSIIQDKKSGDPFRDRRFEKPGIGP
ncbi:hypothetical protein [uncultured Slackia sp.]|uniref:hypothetical protein n=1 Tax=uncultured Slackia sp. TaxID=665903 RepID=UPI0026DFD503|nr:hypothetical protein [uncultured Slackia sp.]